MLPIFRISFLCGIVCFSNLALGDDFRSALQEAEAELRHDSQALLDRVAHLLENDDSSWSEADQQRAQTIYNAVQNRLALAKFCLDRLEGPDQMETGLQIASRYIREGSIEKGLDPALKEKGVAGATRILLLATTLDHLRALPEQHDKEPLLDELFAIYSSLPEWGKHLTIEPVAKQLVKGGRQWEAVGFAENLQDWRRPFLISQTSLFPADTINTLRTQAHGMAQRLETPAARSDALARIAISLHEAGEAERAATVAQEAADAALQADPAEAVAAHLTLARFHARRGDEKESKQALRRVYQHLSQEEESWLQTDGYLDIARAARAEPALAELHGQKIEDAALTLIGKLSKTEGQNKFRLFELLGATTAVTPADEFSADKQAALFLLLLRIDEMPVERWED